MLKAEHFCVMLGIKTEKTYFHFMLIQQCVIQEMEIERYCFDFMPKGENQCVMLGIKTPKKALISCSKLNTFV